MIFFFWHLLRRLTINGMQNQSHGIGSFSFACKIPILDIVIFNFPQPLLLGLLDSIFRKDWSHLHHWSNIPKVVPMVKNGKKERWYCSLLATPPNCNRVVFATKERMFRVLAIIEILYYRKHATGLLDFHNLLRLKRKHHVWCWYQWVQWIRLIGDIPTL